MASKQNSGGVKKIGRMARKPSHANQSARTERNKRKRTLQSCGKKFAAARLLNSGGR